MGLKVIDYSGLRSLRSWLMGVDWLRSGKRWRHSKMECNTDRTGHLEVKNDGPYQPQGQLGVAISDVIIPDVHQLDL